ncbi:MAG: PAS domain S-box protein [Chitinophagaceae bacterium]|nr:PAS domain S-box protein [Rubrivivax sp.]
MHPTSWLKSRRALPLVGGLVLVILLLAAAFNAWLLRQSQQDEREQAVESANQRATQLVAAVAERIQVLVRSADFAMLQLRAVDFSAAADARARVGALLEAFPETSLVNAIVVNANGDVIFSNSGPTGNNNLRDRMHFRAHLGGGDRLFIGNPVIGRVAKAWTVPFTRPVLTDGRFAGIVVVGLSPQKISQVLATLELEPQDSISVLNEEGFLLARNRDIDKFVGRAYPRVQPFRAPGAAASGSYRATAVTDGVDRFFAWRRIEGTGLVTVVGLGAATVLAPLSARHAREWWSAALVSAALPGLSILVLGLLTRIARSQQIVAESETKLRRLIDGMGPDIFLGLMRIDGVLIEASRPALQAAGLEFAEVLDKPFEQTAWWAYSPAVQQQLRDAIARAAAGVSSRYDVQVRVADGKLAWIDFSLQPLRSESGEVINLVPSAMVIEARKQAEAALRGRELRVSGLIESAMDAVVSINAAQQILLFNPAAEKMFGHTTAAVLGRNIDMLIPPRHRGGHAAHIQTFGRTRVTSRRMGSLGRIAGLRADGSEFAIEASISQFELDGEPVYTVILRDITEREQAESALRDSEQRLQAVTENLSEGLVIGDLDGRLLHWNRAALAIHGYTDMAQCLRLRPEFADTFTLGPPGGPPLAPEAWPLARVLAGEPVQGVILVLHHRAAGWDRTLSYSGAVVSMADGRRLAYLSMTDVSARVAAEARILQLNAELEQRVQQRTEELEAKSQELQSFCYSVSHDLKAPLRGIDGYSRLLLESHGGRLDDEGRLFAGNVRTAAAQMTALIDDLLAYSRQERRGLELKAIELRPFVEDQLTRRHADLARVRLEVDIPDMQVLADRESLAMALRNLIDNALKFSAGRERPAISIRGRVGGARCVLSVQDNGSGFDMRFHDRIFEIFQRLHRVEEYPGTGIGLALVRKAAERMGGRIWADSAPDAGATFHLELRRCAAGSTVPAALETANE